MTANALANGYITTEVTMNGKTEIFPPAPFAEVYWIACEIAFIFISIIAVYLFVCLAKFGLHTGCKPGSELRGKKGRVLYQTCLISVAMTVFRLVCDHIVALVGWQSDSKCQISVTFSIVAYSLNLYPVYIFLWLRQSIFYSSPVLSNVLNPIVTVVSWGILVGMLIGGAILTVLFAIPDITGWNYKASKEGCRDVADVSGFELLPIVFFCFIVLIQCGLLLLFIYPLVSKKTLKYREAGRGSVSSRIDSNTSDQNAENSSNVFQPEQDSNPDVSDANLTNDKQQVIADDSICSKNNKLSEAEKTPTKESPIYQPGVLYRNQLNEKEDGAKIEKKTIQKNKAYSIGRQLKRGLSWSVSSSGFRSKKRRGSRTQQGRRVIRFIRKAFFLTLTCVLSDAFFTVIQLAAVLPELAYLALFDVNLLINIICIILSFRNWPKMILPCCVRSKKRKEKKYKSKFQRPSFVAVERSSNLPVSMSQDKTFQNSNLSPKHFTSQKLENGSPRNKTAKKIAWSVSSLKG